MGAIKIAQVLGVAGLGLGLGLALSASVIAQDSAPLPSDEPATKRARLDEIIVSAQKRDENIQDVPLSVTAIDGDAIEVQQMADLQDLSKFAPNTKINTTAGIEYVYMRGLGSTGNRGFEQSVGVFVDGIHFGRTLFLSFGLTDIDRVEVLRGPQGTLFGKNTIAGAINVFTNKPHEEWEARLAARFGNRENRHFEAIVNAPVLKDDKLNLRLVLQKSDMEGHIDNTFRDTDEADSDRQGVRAKLLSRPTDTLEIILGGSYETYDSKGWGGQLTAMPDLFRPVVESYDPTTDYSGDDYTASTNSPGGTDRWTATLNGTASLDIGQHSVTMILSHAAYEDEFKDDIDNSAAPILLYRGLEDFNQQSLELRATSGPGDFDYVLGLYGVRNHMRLRSFGSLFPFDSVGDFTPQLISFLDPILAGLNLGSLLSLLPIGGDNYIDSFDANVTVDSLSFAAYGQANWHMTDKLTLTFGLRYSWERKKLDFFGYQDSTALVRLFIGAEAINEQKSQTEHDLSPKVALAYAFTDDIMAYSVIARGFKAGGFNAQTFQADDLDFGPEQSTTFEAGLKTTWLDGQALLNLSVFHTRFTDLQVSTFSGISFVVNNAASAISQGIELDGMISPVEGLFIITSAAYLDATYKDRQNGPCPDTDPGADPVTYFMTLSGNTRACDLSGERLPYAPKWQGTIAVSYEKQLFNWPIMLSVNGSAIYQGSVVYQEDQDVNDRQSSYWRFDLGGGFRDIDDVWSVTASVRNLSDQVVRMFAADVPVLAGAHVAFVEPPRTFLVEGRVNF